MTISGIGSQTVAAIAMRVLRDPDVIPSARPLRDQVATLAGSHGEVDSLISSWGPWRGYAAMYVSGSGT